jgi:hypothetical protein
MVNLQVDYVLKIILLLLQSGDNTHGIPVSLNSIYSALSQKKTTVYIFIEYMCSLIVMNYVLTTSLIQLSKRQFIVYH